MSSLRGLWGLLSNSNSRRRRRSTLTKENSFFGEVASSRSRARNSTRRDMVNLHGMPLLVVADQESK